MMNRVEMNDEMMEQVIGGRLPITIINAKKKIYIHDECGGVINNPTFGYAKCEKCGEEHWFLWDFAYHTQG